MNCNIQVHLCNTLKGINILKNNGVIYFIRVDSEPDPKLIEVNEKTPIKFNGV